MNMEEHNKDIFDKAEISPEYKKKHRRKGISVTEMENINYEDVEQDVVYIPKYDW